jgi:glycosyltransferase involved in cell wall biosynthesis
MRVLHVYSGNLYGGIETMLATIARCRDVCPEMESHFALCFEGRLSEELRAAGSPVHMLGNVRARRPATVLRARRSFSELLRHTAIDTVICHAAWSQAIFGPVARDAGLPLVFWLHDATEGKHWLERWARRTPPDLALCNSKYTEGTLKNLYRDVESQVIYCPVMPNAVSVDFDCAAVRADLDTPADAIVIIQVSRMEAWKGHALHLEALAELREVPDWICWMVGGAQRPHEVSYLDELKAMAVNAGIGDRVLFFGEQQGIQELLLSADVFCQPNVSAEPFGISFIEALYAELPVVGTAAGGVCEIVDDSCGMLVPPSDHHALKIALLQLISDDAKRQALGVGATTRARQLCDPTQQLDLLHSKLTSVVSLQMA